MSGGRVLLKYLAGSNILIFNSYSDLVLYAWERKVAINEVSLRINVKHSNFNTQEKMIHEDK